MFLRISSEAGYRRKRKSHRIRRSQNRKISYKRKNCNFDMFEECKRSKKDKNPRKKRKLKRNVKIRSPPRLSSVAAGWFVRIENGKWYNLNKELLVVNDRKYNEVIKQLSKYQCFFSTFEGRLFYFPLPWPNLEKVLLPLRVEFFPLPWPNPRKVSRVKEFCRSKLMLTQENITFTHLKNSNSASKSLF